jgi:hypothetical protein
VHRHRGALNPVGLAWLGLWLKTAPLLYGGVDVDPAAGGGDRSQCCRQQAVAFASLLAQLPLHPLFVHGDVHYHTSELSQHCQQRGRTLVTTQYGPYPHTGPDVEVRRLFHKLRSTALENFNEQFKGIFCAYEQVPTNGEVVIRSFDLGAVLLYQMTLWYRHEQNMHLRVGLKPFLRAA